MSASIEVGETMDALSKLLRTIRLQGATFVEADPEKRCYLPPVPRSLDAARMPRSVKVMAFHLVTEGRCVTWLPGSEPIELCPGDLALFPVGNSLEPFELSHESSHLAVEQSDRLEAPGVFTVGPAKLVCGYVESAECVDSSLLRMMPKLLHIRSSSAVTTWLQALMSACVIELDSTRAGSSIIAERIAELMLMEAIRHYVIQNAAFDRSTDIRSQS